MIKKNPIHIKSEFCVGHEHKREYTSFVGNAIRKIGPPQNINCKTQ